MTIFVDISVTSTAAAATPAARRRVYTAFVCLDDATVDQVRLTSPIIDLLLVISSYSLPSYCRHCRDLSSHLQNLCPSGSCPSQISRRFDLLLFIADIPRRIAITVFCTCTSAQRSFAAAQSLLWHYCLQ